MLETVRIAPNLTFADIESGVGLAKVYVRLVETWILDTADLLLKDYPPDRNYRGVAALSLLLQFFEPHGEMLHGTAATRRSKQFFCDAFLAFSIHSKLSDKLSPEDVYKWARCGLFHQARLSPRMLIDAFAMQDLPFYQNPVIVDGWLVNPSALSKKVREYLISYEEEISADPRSEKAIKFEVRIKQALDEPLNYFRRHLTNDPNNAQPFSPRGAQKAARP